VCDDDTARYLWGRLDDFLRFYSVFLDLDPSAAALAVQTCLAAFHFRFAKRKTVPIELHTAEFVCFFWFRWEFRHFSLLLFRLLSSQSDFTYSLPTFSGLEMEGKQQKENDLKEQPHLPK